MSEGTSRDLKPSAIEAELYFLICKFLQNGPCKDVAEALIDKLEGLKLFPQRTDWKGELHSQKFETLVNSNAHIPDNLLLKICERIKPLLDKDVKSSVPGVKSLLGRGSHSVLRRVQDVKPPEWKPYKFTAKLHNKPLPAPVRFNRPPNMVNVIQGRAQCGVANPHQLVPLRHYLKMARHLRTLGHLSAVYCVTFDRTGRRIFTGSDDHLVKIWCSENGRLLATLRGHSAEIVDMHVNFENTMIAAASTDKVIRVWNIQTLSPVAVLMGHTGSITSLEFSPYNQGTKRYMATTGADGCICFWQWDSETSVFNQRPVKMQERSKAGAQMLCLSFSAGGMFLVAGSSDPMIRVYSFISGSPEKIAELEDHMDRVDSIDFCHSGDRFISGSKDGTARIWRYKNQSWISTLLNMSTRLTGVHMQGAQDRNKVMKHRVTMVGWDLLDRHVVTAVNDQCLRVWNSFNGKLVHILQGHTDEIFVLQAHPWDTRVFLSAGHDGVIILWDLIAGRKIHTFYNTIEGQGHGAVFDCMFSCYGDRIAMTDSHGFLTIFGYGAGDEYKKVPTEQYFHTDYRPLVRDANNYVLDEQTQQAPHLMPPPFLVDIDGNPHPKNLQRLVPGRENCTDDALVPLIAITDEGGQEIIGEGESSHNGVVLNETAQASSILDDIIHRMQEEQDANMQGGASGSRVEASRPTTPRGSSHNPLSPNLTSPRGLRRSGEVEGVRQAMGNVAIGRPLTKMELLSRRKFVPELLHAVKRCEEERRQALGDLEQQHFSSESSKRPPLKKESSSDQSERMLRKRKKLKKQQHSYGTRSQEPEIPINGEGDEMVDVERLVDSSGDEVNMSNLSDSEEGGSSDYSDWIEEAGINLQPPKRKAPTKRKYKRRRARKKRSKEDTKQTPRKKPKRRLKKKVPKMLVVDEQPVTELPEEYKPSPWITDTNPRRSPYVPQMGDEVMYFWQGHKCYVEAVKRHNIYVIDGKKFPWNHLDLKTEELMKVVGIKYHIGPPTTCGLKLAFIDQNTRKQTGGFFQLRYHDMADVIDFLVLAQHYDIAMKRRWKTGDRFRAVIDDKWWLGAIENKVPLEAEHPDSLFQCFPVRWDNEEAERMSPWDLEPIDKRNIPKKVGTGVPVTPAEIQQLQYDPQPGEWGDCDQNTECERILKCLDQVMSLRVAEMFNAPVDLSAYPDYAMMVPYPTDLTTIKTRLELRFYRRRSALQWEVRRIEWNANVFNDPNSQIVKSAKLVTNILLEVIRDVDLDNAITLYNQMVGNTDEGEKSEGSTSESAEDSSSIDESDDSNKPPAKKRRSMRTYDDKAWIRECQALLEVMFDCQDSTPFRQPVDESIYQNYSDVIDHPMDLSTVRENLNAGFYQDPIEFAKDVRLIFTNSKAYNTNKKSQIYSMTLRLSALFEDKVRDTMRDYKNAAKHKILTKGKRRPSWFQKRLQSEQSSQSDVLPDDRPGPSGISTRSKVKQGLVPNGYSQSSQQSEESDGSDSDTIPLTKHSSGDENQSSSSQSSSQEEEEDEEEEEDDSDAMRGQRTPTKQNPRRKGGRPRGRRKVQSRVTRGKMPRKTTRSTKKLFEDKDEPYDSPSMRTRNRGRRTVVYDENDSDDLGEELPEERELEKESSEDEGGEEVVTISSRGRRRRPTLKARAHLLND
ncbi:Bromodomain and WD repeat-containing protein 3 [Holothuria leucospilota]|uniref:Bromodomain and WD repeat-containing protein 3 n=1 Tax=Holothuria leucospilota TaxID=206669 RepID=A0A9Q0YSV9_HOLLE|nr:Bromodomain and WD repeat-containing protein 3 [Holothuria leucospilota]